jgi:hypothetical protein
MHNGAANQLLTVTEPSRLGDDPARELTVRCWKISVSPSRLRTDLRQWQPLSTLTNVTGTLEFSDSTATYHSCARFYRAVQR